MLENINEHVAAVIANDVSKENLGHIDVHKTRELITDAGAMLLDVRPLAKVEGENAQEAGIKNAYYTPYPTFAEYLDLLPEDKTTPIVAACNKGWFSNRVMTLLGIMGYTNVLVLDTAITALIEAHYAHTGR